MPASDLRSERLRAALLASALKRALASALTFALTFTLAFSLATVSVGACAHDGSHPGPAGTAATAANQPWSFTLPTLDGSRFVALGELRGPVLVNFWGVDCGPCIAELPMLERFARDNPRWTVLLVATDPPPTAREFVQKHGLQLTVLKPGANVAGLMRAAGNRSGGLPFTVAWGAGSICRAQSGALEPAQLAQLQQQCETRP